MPVPWENGKPPQMIGVPCLFFHKDMGVEAFLWQANGLGQRPSQPRVRCEIFCVFPRLAKQPLRSEFFIHKKNKKLRLFLSDNFSVRVFQYRKLTNSPYN